MNQKENEMKQRELLREFDKELFTYTGQISWFLSGIFSFISLCLLAIPMQEVITGNENLWTTSCMCAIWIPYSVLLPYINMTDAFTPHQKHNRTYDKLKYLPVSKKQYRIVRMEYLFRYIWKLTIVGLVVQCSFTIITVGSVSVWNIVYVAAILFVLPLFCGWILLH